MNNTDEHVPNVGSIVCYLRSQERSLKRSIEKRKANPSDGIQIRLQAVRDAVEIVKTCHPPRARPIRYTWDRWANGNQYGSYNSDDD